MEDLEPKLEAVYYGSPLPTSSASLTALALVFDRLHFPGVHLPSEGYDLDAVEAEATRIEKIGPPDYERAILVGSLRILKHVPYLKHFCNFESDERLGPHREDAKEAKELVRLLDEAIWGPPKPGFFPTHEIHTSKALPGGSEGVDYPGALYYPARALLYSARKGLPLVNDNPGLPVPGGHVATPRNNAKALATILALECAALAVPTIRPLRPSEIVEARAELKPFLLPYRAALFKLAKELNSAIASSASDVEVREAARFLVETDVAPAVAQLEDAIRHPSRDWLTIGFDVARQVPELVTTFATMPAAVGYAKLLATAGALALDLRKHSAKCDAQRSNMYFLLKLRAMQKPLA